MAIEKTQGLILRSVDFSETSKVLTLFTPDFGKLGVLAKGGRRLRSNFEVALDLLSVCGICVLRKPSAELDLLTEAVLIERFDGLRRELPALYAAYYVAEILDGLLESRDPHPSLWEPSIETLRALSTGAANRLLTTVRFQWTLLKEIGYEPNLDCCAACGEECPLADRMAFSAAAGGVLCRRCAGSTADRRTIHGGTVEVVRTLIGSAGEGIGRLQVESSSQKELWAVGGECIRQHLGRRPKSESMLRF